MKNLRLVGTNYLFSTRHGTGALQAPVPMQIAGCAAWYRADLSSVIGTTANRVIQISDLSGNQRHAQCSGTLPTRVTLDPAFQKQTRWTFATGSTVTVQNSIVAPGSDRSVVMVSADQSGVQLSGVQFSQDDTHRLAFFFRRDATAITFTAGPGSTVATSNRVISDVTPATAYLARYTAYTKALAFRVRGLTGTVTTNITADDSGTTAPGAILMTSVYPTFTANTTYCAEIIIYNRVISSADITKLATYIYNRYRIAL